MGDDDASGRHVWRDFAQALGDVFVGETVKAVAADALIVKVLRQGEVVRQGVMTAMKSGVETCDLRQFGPGSEQ